MSNEPNRGTIAKNTRKTDEKHADITGSINVEGKEFWISGWLRTSGADGGKFYSLSVKPKEAKGGYSRDKANRQIDDDQPF